ncbi:MAG: hypothetical protein IAF38_10550, partial [Bacteroidia bacterium]|nr:hypothetical protein [Bacteroidia bacterium]
MFSKDHKQIDLDGENILIHLSKLKRELPVKSTLYNYPFSYFFDPYKVLSDTKNMQRDLQIIADQMVEYLLLPKKIKIILTDKMDASGKYMDLGVYKNIFINS